MKKRLKDVKYDPLVGMRSTVDCISNTYNNNKKESFKVLNVIHVKGYSYKIQSLNYILTMNIIVNKRLFVIIENFKIKDGEDVLSTENFLSSFKRLCKNIYKLLINEQISINIKIKFCFLNSQFNAMNSIFISQFNDKKVFSKYKKPKCNNLICSSLENPIISFSIVKEKYLEYVYLVVANCQCCK